MENFGEFFREQKLEPNGLVVFDWFTCITSPKKTCNKIAEAQQEIEKH